MIIIFDIDGTLTETHHIDPQCFDQALKEVFSIEIPPKLRATFNSSTDSGLLQDVHTYFKKKSPTSSEEMQFKKTFFALLEQHIPKISPIAIKGAKAMLMQLRALPDVAIAFATGAWLESAKLKLSLADIYFDESEITSADEGNTKNAVLEIALTKMRQRYPAAQNTIYIGDRHWDFLAANNLEMKFIGIGNDPKMHTYQHPDPILPDFNDMDSFLELINHG